MTEPVTALVENCTFGELIKEYKEIEAEIDELVADHKKVKGEKERRLSVITGALTILLDRSGQEGGRTVYGTAYFYPTETMKVADRETYLNWVIENKAIDIITSSVSKDAVRDRLKRGEVIPGLEITSGRALTVRKP